MKTEVHKIYGAPGTGKTTSIIEIINNSGIPLDKIAYCTFGKKAMSDMIYKMSEKGILKSELPYFKTVHSMNFSLLGIKKDQVADMKLEEFCKEKKFKLSLLKPMEEMGLIDTNFSDKVVTLDDTFYMHMQEDRTLLRPFNFIPPKLRNYAGTYMRFKHAYKDWMAEHDYIDFIGMIEQGIERGVVPPVEMLCVDEWQDLNPLQIKQVMMWAQQIPLSYHAGDDDQCIFEFAGADPSSFLKMQCDHEVILGETFRLPSDILALSQEVIKRNKNRKDKVIHTNKPEGGIYIKPMYKVCEMLRELLKTEKCVILVRNNFMIRPLMSDLAEEGIPLGSLIKERQAVHLMQKGYSLERFKHEEIDILLNSRLFPSSRYFKRGVKTNKKIMQFIPDGGYTRSQLLSLGFLPQLFIDINKKDCSFLNIKGKDLEYIMKLFKTYGYNGSNQVQIATIHQYKGLEADNVILVPDITKTCYENERAKMYDVKAVESERRVWYTAITRAKKRLILLDRTFYSNYKTYTASIIYAFTENMKKLLSVTK